MIKKITTLASLFLILALTESHGAVRPIRQLDRQNVTRNANFLDPQNDMHVKAYMSANKEQRIDREHYVRMGILPALGGAPAAAPVGAPVGAMGAAPTLVPEEKDKAATTIQKTFRGHVTRKRLKAEQEKQRQKQAATTIQKTFRDHLTRKRLKAEQEKQRQNQAATTIQKTFRGYLVRKNPNAHSDSFSEGTGSEDWDDYGEDWQGDLADKEREAAIKIQRYFRNYRDRKRGLEAPIPAAKGATPTPPISPEGLKKQRSRLKTTTPAAQDDQAKKKQEEAEKQEKINGLRYRIEELEAKQREYETNIDALTRRKSRLQTEIRGLTIQGQDTSAKKQELANITTGLERLDTSTYQADKETLRELKEELKTLTNPKTGHILSGVRFPKNTTESSDSETESSDSEWQ